MFRKFFKDLGIINLFFAVSALIIIFIGFYLVYQQQGSEYAKLPRSGDYSKSKSTIDIFLQKF